MLRRTPCIGICSTTYGDLVCRGCKRFAHEIVQWNGFDQTQRQAVWHRLLELRAGAVRSVLVVFDEQRLRAEAGRAGLAVEGALDAENLLYELLQRLQWRAPDIDLESIGVSLQADADLHLAPAPESLLSLIDREFYHRSMAQYERNYRIPAE